MTIEERLENMEKELGRGKRRTRWLLGAILLLIGGLVAAGVLRTMITPVQAQGAGTVKEVRAKNIVLEDENGKVRALLAVSKDGPVLALYEENGKPRATLGILKDGPFLTLHDENGKARAGLSAFKDGPGLLLWGENGEPRATLGILKDGPVLALHDENGKARAGLGVKKGSPAMELLDENEKIRFVAGKTTTVSPDGKTIEYPESSLILFGPDGKVIWSAIK